MITFIRIRITICLNHTALRSIPQRKSPQCVRLGEVLWVQRGPLQPDGVGGVSHAPTEGTSGLIEEQHRPFDLEWILSVKMAH